MAPVNFWTVFIFRCPVFFFPSWQLRADSILVFWHFFLGPTIDMKQLMMKQKSSLSTRFARTWIMVILSITGTTPTMIENFTIRLEKNQHSAALAVTIAWRGTNRQELYNELGWESLYNRRWLTRLCHFFNLRKTGNPAYLIAEFPIGKMRHYELREKHSSI